VIYPKLAAEGIIATDNMYDPPMHLPEARVFREAVQSKPDLQSTLLPIGSGIEMTCRWPKDSAKL
jgi:predicted O-methyltransferase YrrM